MYAFALTKEKNVTSIPDGSTITPFWQSVPKRKRPPQEADPYSRFSSGNGDHNYRRKRGRREKSPPPGPDRCFFCLSNPTLPTHMVSSIGEDVYLATAKGPLPSATTFSKEGLRLSGAHDHCPADACTYHNYCRHGANLQCQRTRKCLVSARLYRRWFLLRTKRKLGSVTWEIHRARNIHTHWQFLPVPASQVKSGLVEAAFRVEAENLKLPKLEVKDFETGDDVPGDYFPRLDMGGGGRRRRWRSQ